MSCSSVYTLTWHLIAGVILALTACHRSLPLPSPDELPELGILLDASTFTGTKRKLSPEAAKLAIAELRCPEAAQAVYQLLAQSDVNHVAVAVFQTGEVASTAGEPIPLIPWTEFSFVERAFGKKVPREREVQGFVADLDQRCRERIRPTVGSPILLGLTRTAETLRAHAVDLKQQGKVVPAQHLFLASDLRENADQALRMRIRGIATALREGKPIPPHPHPATLDLGAVTVHLCGLSSYEADAGESLYTAQAVPLAWRELFKDPAPSFGAVCPRYQTPAALAKIGGRS